MNAFRIYHVLFAGAAAAAWFTAESLGIVHAWTGYAVAALLALRALLGMARARGFQFARIALRPGHGPAGQSGLRHPNVGRALTLALLLTVASTAATGIAMDRGGTLIGHSIRADDKNEEGAKDRSAMASARPGAGDDADEEGEREGGEEHGLLGELHETSGNMLLPLVALHVLWLALFRLDLARFVLFIPRRRAA
ncbi:MAG: hypothetical protein RIS94_2993 [Pseudomonadota bacterium]|jgi:cytochrome b